MAIEIERKFLLKYFPNVDHETRVSITQGYLNLDKNKTVRVRVSGSSAFLTVKGLTQGASRKEFEYPIPLDDARDMLMMCKETSITKDRIFLAYQGKDIWEIDIFHGKNSGLIVAEIEVSSEDYEINLPDWIGEEVTNDPRYYNSNLIIHPFNTW